MDTGSLGPSTVTGRRQSPGACWPPGAGCVSGQEQLVLPCPAAPQQKFALADVLCGTWWPLWPNLWCPSEMLAFTNTGRTFSRQKLRFQYQITNPRLETVPQEYTWTVKKPEILKPNLKKKKQREIHCKLSYLMWHRSFLQLL